MGRRLSPAPSILSRQTRLRSRPGNSTSSTRGLARQVADQWRGFEQWGLYYVMVGKGIREIGIHYNLYPATAWDEEEEVIEEECSDYPVLISVCNAKNLDFYDNLFIEDPEFQGILIEREIDEDGD